MKFKAEVEASLNMTEVIKKVEDASRLGMRDVTVEVHAQTVEEPPLGSPRLTGNNARSLAAEVSGMGIVGGTENERMVDDSKIEGVVYSTSGYGGFLETGTQHMPARPYIVPAGDRYFTEGNLGKAIKRYMD